MVRLFSFASMPYHLDEKQAQQETDKTDHRIVHRHDHCYRDHCDGDISYRFTHTLAPKHMSDYCDYDCPEHHTSDDCASRSVIHFAVPPLHQSSDTVSCKFLASNSGTLLTCPMANRSVDHMPFLMRTRSDGRWFDQ